MGYTKGEEKERWRVCMDGDMNIIAREKKKQSRKYYEKRI